VRITFATRKLQKLCTSIKVIKGELDKARMRKLQQRLMEIKAVDSLADLYKIKTLHCHQLIRDFKGAFAINLDESVRIVFIIADDPVPKLPDGSIDRENAKEIEIIGIGDYH